MCIESSPLFPVGSTLALLSFLHMHARTHTPFLLSPVDVATLTVVHFRPDLFLFVCRRHGARMRGRGRVARVEIAVPAELVTEAKRPPACQVRPLAPFELSEDLALADFLTQLRCGLVRFPCGYARVKHVHIFPGSRPATAASGGILLLLLLLLLILLSGGSDTDRRRRGLRLIKITSLNSLTLTKAPRLRRPNCV
jgi:hypothetical protein